MASACGIHIDQRRFRLVALEGSAKKQRVRAYTCGEVPFGEDPVDHVASELRRFAKKNKVPAENVGLAVDSGAASFRNLTLPFDDRAKIEEVIKFEVENDLPQWDIDDVIVDFLITDSKPGVESDLLVTALPKERLSMQLAACEAAGLEPLEAELDGTALFSAIDSAGLLDEESAQVLVHVGDATTVVVVVDAGKIRSMRAIRAGSRPVLPPPSEVEEEAEEESGEEESVDLEATESAVERYRRLEQSAQRIRRELVRTISAARTEHPLEVIYLFGDDLPGLTNGELDGMTIERPDVVPLEEDGPENGELVVAFGAALNRLGSSKLSPHLRREELRHTGKFERLELPLAVLGLLLTTLLGVRLIVTNQLLLWRDEGKVSSWNSEQPLEGDMQIWLRMVNAYMLPDPEKGYPGRLKNPPQAILEYARDAERGEDQGRTKYQELVKIKADLMDEIRRLQKELGLGATEDSAIPQPQSALKATTLVLDVIDGLGEEVGRFGIRRLLATSFTRQGADDPYRVDVTLDLDFFAEDSVVATAHYTNFRDAIQANDWCIEFVNRPNEVFDDGRGIGVAGIKIGINLDKLAEAEEQVNQEAS